MITADAETIVVGVDGSECGDTALDTAISEAARSGRVLLLVYAWSWISGAITDPFGGRPDGRRTAAALLEREAEKARRHHVPVHVHLIEGDPAKGLIKVADKAAMLVVGSHGYRGFTKAMLGSVSQECVENANCPVLVVSPHLAMAGHRQQDS